MYKARVFFFDGEDIDSGEFYSLEEAIREDYVVIEGDEITPFDECAIICWYKKLGDEYTEILFQSPYHTHEFMGRLGKYILQEQG